MPQTTLQFFLWALPLFMCLHVFEEFAYPGGFIRWISTHNSKRLKATTYYVVINAVAILVATTIALTATNIVGYSAYIWYAAFMAMNGISHLIAVFQERSYCPGCVTGIVLFTPLLIASIWKFTLDNLINWQSMALNVFVGAIVAMFMFPVHRRQKAIQQ